MLQDVVRSIYDIALQVLSLEIPLMEFSVSFFELLIFGIIFTLLLGFIFRFLSTSGGD